MSARTVDDAWYASVIKYLQFTEEYFDSRAYALTNSADPGSPELNEEMELLCICKKLLDQTPYKKVSP
jgi:hypothetical protein